MKPDLNLLVVFDAVASCGSVSSAAERLALSQPAVSHALNRLRAHFGDQLFIRKGAGVQPTLRAAAMIKDIRQLLQVADMVFANRLFDPALTSRKFKIATSDYALSLLLPSLQRKLLIEAPYSQLNIIQTDSSVLEQLERGNLDCSYWGTTIPEGPWCSQTLFREHYIGVVSNDHPLALEPGQREIGLEQYLACRHIVVSMKDPGRNQIDITLAKLGKQRQVAVTSYSFTGNLKCLFGTDLIASMPARLFQAEALPGLKTFKLPFDVPFYDYSLIWHRRAEKDEGHRWLRKQIIDAAKLST